MFCLLLFLWMRTIFPFLHSEGNTPAGRACLKIISSGTRIESPHILACRYLSCPWTLFKSGFWLIFSISLAENVTVDRHLSAIYLRSTGRELLLVICVGALFRKKNGKFCFFFKISYKVIFIKQWGYNR